MSTFSLVYRSYGYFIRVKRKQDHFGCQLREEFPLLWILTSGSESEFPLLWTSDFWGQVSSGGVCAG